MCPAYFTPPTSRKYINPISNTENIEVKIGKFRIDTTESQYINQILNVQNYVIGIGEGRKGSEFMSLDDERRVGVQKTYTIPETRASRICGSLVLSRITISGVPTTVKARNKRMQRDAFLPLGWLASHHMLWVDLAIGSVKYRTWCIS